MDGSTRTQEAGFTKFGFCPDFEPDLQVGQPLRHLFISSQDVAQSLEMLQAMGITHILNVATGVANAFPENFIYQNIAILDLPEVDILPLLSKCFDFISEGLKRGKVLVHCNAGISRSAAVICGYIMKEKGMEFQGALSLVKASRPSAHPNRGFIQQLTQHQNELMAGKI